MDRAQVERWLDAYRQAWASDAPSDIEALFTEGATYSPFPFTKEVWQGRDRIVEKWMERGDSGSSWLFEHTILAVEGDTAVVEGRTLYHATEHDPEAEYSNIWAVRFAEDGRAREFREWWVERGPDDATRWPGPRPLREAVSPPREAPSGPLAGPARRPGAAPSTGRRGASPAGA